MSDCPLCKRLSLLKGKADPTLVHEFDNSVLVVGEHQFYPGYCVLILKPHVRELHELSPEIQTEFHHELMQATQAIAKAYKPWKFNHASLGNVVGHVHWHIFPRYRSDPQKMAHPWIHEAEFELFKPNNEQLKDIAARIAEHIR